MATKKKAETVDSLYDEVLAETAQESAARKRSILKERVLELRKARRVLTKLED